MEIQNTRGFFIFEGILFALLGLLAIALPVASTMATELFIGWLLIIGGAIQGYRAFKAIHHTGSYVSILSALLNIILGVLFIAFPGLGMTTLTLLLIFFFLLQGITKIVLGLQLRKLPNWFWLVLSGILSLAMALIIWSGWPGSAFWVVGLLVGINMLFFGIALLSLGITMPKSRIDNFNDPEDKNW